MDISATVTKRRSIPRILSSSKKNSWLSPIDTNFIKDDAEDTGGDSFNTLTPKKEEADCSEEDHDTSSLPARTCNRSRGLITLQTGRGRTTPPLSQLKEEIKTEELEAIDDCQEIRVNPMITIRRGAQVHIPSRRVRCQVATNLVTPENCDPSKLTPNEMLLAVSNS
ncbi:hypothetical protein GCK32_012647 [Trichostrongylus colubriformis]|uniref:Uncharacterized protein n=1 Tax=Trichostrongylus colubriformis TaxID=6319 RepID=A0AAN8FUE8_TRICO